MRDDGPEWAKEPLVTKLRPLLPLVLILATAIGAWALGLVPDLSWRSLAAHQAWLKAAVAAHPILAGLAFFALYAAAAAAAIPGAGVLTIVGGLAFGVIAGGVLSVLGATTGGVLLFLAARSAFSGLAARLAGPFLARIRPGLERDGFIFLFALRLLPVFPFWLLNLAPALLHMPLRPYALATMLGIVPATFIFASIGAGLGDLLASGREPNILVIFSPGILLPLLGLAVLSLLPVIWRHWKARHA